MTETKATYLPEIQLRWSVWISADVHYRQETNHVHSLFRDVAAGDAVEATRLALTAFRSEQSRSAVIVNLAALAALSVPPRQEVK